MYIRKCEKEERDRERVEKFYVTPDRMKVQSTVGTGHERIFLSAILPNKTNLHFVSTFYEKLSDVRCVVHLAELLAGREVLKPGPLVAVCARKQHLPYSSSSCCCCSSSSGGGHVSRHAAEGRKRTLCVLHG